MRLFFYVLRDYVKYSLVTLSLCLFLFVLFDFIHKTTNYFSLYKPSLQLIVQLYLYQLPMFFIQAAPIASLLASVVTMIMLSRSNEISAMRAVGLGPLGIVKPLAIGGMVLSLVSLCVSEWVLPKTASKLRQVQEVKIEGKSDSSRNSSSHWQKNGNKILSFREIDLSSSKIIGVEIIELNPEFRPFRIYQAERGTVDSEKGQIIFDQVKEVQLGNNGRIVSAKSFEKISLEFSLSTDRLIKDRRQPEELSSRELKRSIQRRESNGLDTLSYKVEYYSKFSFAFAAFFVSFIGLNLAYLSERSTETAKHVLAAFGVGISYWFVLNWSKAVGKSGDISPLLSAWLANFVVFGAVFVQDLIRRVYRT